jgi:hypothetical protein
MSEEKKSPFWTSLPGILTGLGSLIGAIVGAYVAIMQIQRQAPEPTITPTPTTTTTREPTTTPLPEITHPIPPSPTPTSIPTKRPSPTSTSVSLPELERQINDLELDGLKALREGRLTDANVKLKAAEDLLNEALAHTPNDIILLNLKGCLHKNWAIQYRSLSMNDAFREQLNEAEMAFKLVLSVDSEDPGALNGLGSVYILRGNLDLAESYVRRALEILPDYEAAKQDLALIERLKARR